MWAMVQKEFRQLRRDHRTVAMMIVMPLVLLVVFGYEASFDVTEIKTVVVGPNAQAVAERLPEPFVVDRVAPDETREDAVATLRDGRAQVAIAGKKVPAIAGVILAFVGVVATSLGVVRERQAGTLEQLAVMPFGPPTCSSARSCPTS
jgi:ABC-2 type transport system permease protein